MSNWTQDLFHVEKPIVTMRHLQPSSGNPYYNADEGMEKVMATVRADLPALQESGVDEIMFSNEFGLPYLTEAEPVMIAIVVRVVSELEPFITVPYGANCPWDPIASIDLAAAVDDKFIHEIISGVYASDFGLQSTNIGKTVRHRMAVGAKDLRLLFNTVPGAARYLVNRDIKDIAGFTEFNNRPDVLCVSGLTAGSETDTQILGQIKVSVKHTPILRDTGCNVNSTTRQLFVADGAVRVTAFKYDGVFENTVDVKRVRESMDKIKEYRATPWGTQMVGMNFKTRPKSGILCKQSL